MSDDEKNEMREFVSEMRELRGELREYRKNQDARCANHSRRLDGLAERGKLIEQAISFREDSEENISARTYRVERLVDRALFAFKAVAWISSAAGVAYAGFAFLVQSVGVHSDKVVK